MGFLEHGDRTGMLADTRANGPAIHALARLPELKMLLLRSLGRFLVPTAGDGSGLGNVLKVRYKLLLQLGLDLILSSSLEMTFMKNGLRKGLVRRILGLMCKLYNASCKLI